MKKLIASLLVLAASAGIAHASTVKECVSNGTPVVIADLGSRVFAYMPELLAANIYEPIGEAVRTNNGYMVNVAGVSGLFSNCQTLNIQLPDIAESESKEQPATETAVPEPTDAEIDAAGHGSEFEMRGDIARPEYKGANTFVGEALYQGTKSIGNVTLKRAANGDITVIANGEVRGTFKYDEDMGNKAGTYVAPRSATVFNLGNGDSYYVYETKLVK